MDRRTDAQDGRSGRTATISIVSDGSISIAKGLECGGRWDAFITISEGRQSVKKLFQRLNTRCAGMKSRYTCIS